MNRARTSWFRRPAIALASLVIAFLLLELAHRAYLALRGVPHDPARVVELIEGSADPLREYQPPRASESNPEFNGFDPVLHPYTGAEFWHDTGEVLAHFRNPRAADVFEVLIVGGSVASLFAETEGRAIADRLRAEPRLQGRLVRVLNYAHIAYKQPQQLNRVTWLLTQGAHPEVVVNLDGFNETALSVEQAIAGTHPLYPYRVVWGLVARDAAFESPEAVRTLARIDRNRTESQAWLDRVLGWNLQYSSVLSTLVHRRLNRLQIEREAFTRELQDVSTARVRETGRTRQVTGPDFRMDAASVRTLCLDGWENASLLLDASCSAFGVQYVHALQPALFDPGSKPMSESERALESSSSGCWVTVPANCHALLRERGAELARRGVDFVDLSRTFEHETEVLYKDPVHVNARGNALLREALMPSILAAAERATR